MADLESLLAGLSPERRRLLELRLKKSEARSLGPVRRAKSEGPLSFAQARLWVMHHLEPESPRYNSPLALRIAGGLDSAALERALAEIVRRHEVLRTVIRATDSGDPVQVVRPAEGFAVPVDDLSGLAEAAREPELRRRVVEEALRPFDLAAGPLFRARLLRAGAADHVLVLAMHHIVTDGWSMGVLFRELGALYEAFSRGLPSPLPELALQYADFAAWQREALTEEALAPHLAWWRERLADAPAVLDLAGDRPRPAVQSHRGARRRLALSASLAERLRAVARRENATLFMVLLAAYDVLLWRWSGETDLVVGSPVAGRTRSELEPMIGFFVNTLALRADLSGDPPFTGLLARVRETTLGAYDHQELPFERLVEALVAERSTSHAPVYQAVFALQSSLPAAFRLPGLDMELFPVDGGTARSDLELLLWEREEGITGTLDFATDLFDAASIDRMTAQLERLLEAVAAAPDARVSALALMDDAERETVVHAWNRTSTDYPREASIPALFEAEARRAPGATAVVFRGERVTYGELNARANRLARLLRRRGVGAETRVGLCAERGPDLVVSLLAILKAGGAYVPLDPAYPRERLAHMLADSGAALVLAQPHLAGALPAESAGVVDLDRVAGEAARESAADLEPAAGAESLAYIVYTSGSTGTPKGVMVSHRSVVRLVRETDYCDFSPSDVFASLAPVAFDASTLELWGPLLNGGALALFPPHAPSLEELARFAGEHGVTRLWLSAGLFHQVVDAGGATFPTLRTLLAGGDVVSPSHVARVLEANPGLVFVNGYGPTENTTFTCCHAVASAGEVTDPLPVGRPIANTRAYVLDAAMRPVPAGLPGELYAGGDGVARGYQGRAALTAAAFLPDPFSATPGARLYRTGDRARWKADGVIEFLGRADAQVKVRGFRVEPGEVEATLRAHPDVLEAAVVARADIAGGRRLVAYVVPEACDPAALREYARARLPEFMVPSAIVPLAAFPLTPNGKVDRRALPAPESGPETGYVAPRTPAEETLAGIFADVLRRPRVGVDDDFFLLGGHSLLATQAIARIGRALGAELPLRALFEAPTVAGLAARLDAAAEAAPPVLPVPRDRAIPLGFAQERMLVLHRMDPESAAYNMPYARRLHGALDSAALERALAALVERHEALRTTFALEGGAPVQVIGPPALALARDDLSALPEAERVEEARRRVREEVKRPFDLSRDPLLRARLLRLGAADHVLVLVVHHAAGDGWSMSVLFRELAAFYDAFHAGAEPPLPKPGVQYADFAVWQRAWLSGPVLEAQLAYWTEALAGAPAVLELPADRPRPATRGYAGEHLPLALPPEAVEGARALARGAGATLFMALLAGFSAVLSRWSGQRDVVVGSPIANRRRAEVEETVGCFANTLALRTDLSGEPGFRTLLARVREATLGAYAHQDLPFERLVEELRVERSLAHTPVFQVMFGLHNAPPGELRLGRTRSERVGGTAGISAFDMSLLLVEAPDGGVSGGLEYSTELFEGATAERLFRHLTRFLQSAAAAPDLPVSALPLMDEAERRTVLGAWNATATPYPRHATIHGLFAETAARAPGAVAILGDGAPVTYGALEARANRLARLLRARGVAGGTPVALALERSADVVAAMLAVLKAGGAYVPVDTAYPPERLRFVLQDAGCGALVVRDEVPEGLQGFAGAVVSLARDADPIAREDASAPAAAVAPESPAYVIYTSGSTGTPKGVVATHRGIVRLVRETNLADFRPDDVTLFLTSPAFDVSAVEIWGALLNGGRIAVFPPGVPSLEALATVLREHAVTIAWLPNGLFNQMVDERPEALAGLRELDVGGEALSVPHARRALERLPGVRLANGYGPTENGVITTRRFVRPEDTARASIPIGEPVSNTRVYILDEALRPCAIGIPGELCAAGDGLALGYAGREALTAERFVVADLGDGILERVYRTGDRARWLPDGSVEFLGRLDGQVKLRGFRIELGEIEAALARHPAVREAAVDVREGVGGPALAAYVVPRDAPAPGAAALRAHLARALPAYMVPAVFVELEALPLNTAGKVDRRALPAPRPASAGEGRTLPRGERERRIAALWAGVLGVESVGAEDNFFELGGNSLLLIALHERLRAELPGSGVALLDLFRHPTVRSLAEHLGGEPERGAEEETRPRGTADGRIAVIGLAGRFPGAPDLDAFWRNLRDGVESVTFFGEEELRQAGVGAALLADPRFVPARAVLEGIDQFDAGFFGYSPRDASVLDPQQRLFLECAWEALEGAGYAPGAPGAAAGVGVFAGSATSGYGARLRSDPETLALAGGSLEVGLANDKDFLATRVSYKLGLQGPSVNVQTACSTSLVAVHQACRSLLAGECALALAGGVTVAVPQKGGYLFEEGGVTSPDGHCRAFDAASRGTVAGSGAGVVVLKRLEDALADGDSVHAVILGSAINNDGSLRVGFTAPGIDGQAKVIRAAQAAAGVDPETVTYVEAHGSGTELGDPIEVAALTDAFASRRRGYCALGSVKTNIGHLDAAAGIAGLVKAILAIRAGEIPPSLHFETPSPKIDFARSPFFVNTRLAPWETGGVPRRAGVSSFGMGGTNAHVVLEEPPELPPAAPSRPWQLLALSARTPTALEAAAGRLAARLRAAPELPLADVAFTLREGRRAFEHRYALVVREGEDAAALLESRAPGRLFRDVARDARRPVAFLFPGLGDQYAGMSRGLYESEPVFRQAVDRCAGILLAHLGSDIREVLYPRGAAPADAPGAGGGGIDLRRMLGRGGAGAGPDAEPLRRAGDAHPALFVVGYALAKLWESWGIVPEAVIGHSLGEYVAACVAGVLSLEDALELVAVRARLVEALPGGSMLAVALSPARVEPLLAGGAVVATVNAPELCVVAGPGEAVEEVRRKAAAAGHVTRPLATTHAFHSPMMRPAAEALVVAASRLRLRPPSIPLVSNVTGTWMSDAEATDPRYWARHLCEPVRFDAGVETLLRDGPVLLEVGPGQSLGAFVRQRPLGAGETAPSIVPSLPAAYDDTPEAACLLAALGRLWAAGARPEWRALSGGERRRRVPLPTYPFERSRHWLEPRPGQAAAGAGGIGPDGRMTRTEEVADWFHLPGWRPTLAPAAVAPDRERHWLVLADSEGVGERVAGRLREMGQDVVVVAAGAALRRTPDGWTLRPGEPEDFRALLRVLAAEGRAPDEVLHLWALPAAEAGEGPDEAFARWSERGWHAIRSLAAAFAAEAEARPVRVQVFASQTAAVDSTDVPVPEKAMMLGALRVLGQEMPRLAGRAVDMEPAEPGAGDRRRRAARIVAEALSGAADPMVALRGARRYVERWERVRVDGSEPPVRTLRERGVYLITGGTGTVGLTLAASLARSCRARLVLTARTPFLPRDEWDGWLAEHTGDDPVSHRIRRIREIEAMGGEVHVAAVDVADEPGMRSLLATLRTRWGRLHGVVHAAGVVHGDSSQEWLASLSREHAGEQFRPKVRGTRVLERVLPPDLDFCLLVSSNAATLGGVGFGAYAAANVFLDAFAAARHARGAHGWISLGSDGWPTRRQGRSSMDALLMTEAEAGEVLRRTVASATVPHLAVALAELEARRAHWLRPGVADAPEPPREARAGRDLLGLSAAYAAPRDDLERWVERLWSELLGVEEIGIHDDFFQLGGHSLLGTRLLARVRQEQGVDLPVHALFRAPTVAAMAAEVAWLRFRATDRDVLRSVLDAVAPGEGALEERAKALAPGARDEVLHLLARRRAPVAAANDEITPRPRRRGGAAPPASLGQEEMWRLDRDDPGNPSLNIGQVARLSGALDEEALERAVAEVVRRHESLRTTFPDAGGRPVQRISDRGSAHLVVHDLTGAGAGELRRYTDAEMGRRFRLEEGPLFSAVLLRLGPDEHALGLVMHHIVGDGWSLGILFGELAALYGAFSRGEPSPLPEPAVQYADWAEWQREHFTPERVAPLVAFWREALAGAPPVLELPADRPRPEGSFQRGGSFSFRLAPPVGGAIRALARAEGTTLFAAMLTVFDAVLLRWTGEEDLVVGTPVANRTRVEAEGLIGYLVNLVPLRARLTEELSFRQALGRVRETVSSAFAHQELPFELLVEALAPPELPGVRPVFQVMFALQNADEPLRLPGITITSLPGEKHGAEFDLTLNVADEDGGGLWCGLEYSADLFDRETMDRFARHFSLMAEGVAEDPDRPLGEMAMLEAEEDASRMMSSPVPSAW